MRRCIAVFVGVYLLTPAAVFGQTPSVLGVELGDTFSEAVQTLRDSGCTNFRTNDLEDVFYVRECEMDGISVTIAGPMDQSDSRDDAPVEEITFSAYEGDVGASTVTTLRDRYRSR